MIERTGWGYFYDAIEDKNGDLIVAGYSKDLFKCPQELFSAAAPITIQQCTRFDEALAWGGHYWDLTLAPNGDVLVATNSVLRKLKADGSFVSVAGHKPEATGGYLLPNGNDKNVFPNTFKDIQSVAVDENGDFVIADLGFQRVMRCPDESGTNCKLVVGAQSREELNCGRTRHLASPRAVQIAPDGDYIVSDPNCYRLMKCPKAGPGDCTVLINTYGISDFGAYIYDAKLL